MAQLALTYTGRKHLRVSLFFLAQSFGTNIPVYLNWPSKGLEGNFLKCTLFSTLGSSEVVSVDRAAHYHWSLIACRPLLACTCMNRLSQAFPCYNRSQKGCYIDIVPHMSHTAGPTSLHLRSTARCDCLNLNQVAHESPESRLLTSHDAARHLQRATNGQAVKMRLDATSTHVRSITTSGTQQSSHLNCCDFLRSIKGLQTDGKI